MPNVLHLPDDGPQIASEEDGRTLVEQGMEHDARWIAVPAARLGDAFFTLSSGLAGAYVQRLQNYGIGLAVVGDVSAHAASSQSFSDLLVESARGGSLVFAEDAEDLTRKLAARG